MAVRSRKHSVDASVGHRLRIRRRNLGISQARLGEMIGVTFQQVQKYETAANRISASALMLTATALEVPVSYFFQGLEDFDNRDKTAEDGILKFIASAEGDQLARDFPRIAPRHRRAVLDLVRAMIEEQAAGAAEMSRPDHLAH